MSRYALFVLIPLIAFSFGGFTGGVVFGEVLPEEKQPMEFVQHVNTAQKFSVRYPSSWRAYEIPSMSYVRFENMDADSLNSLPQSERNNYFKIEVVTLPNPNNLPLHDWVQKQNTTSYPLPKVLEQRNIEVAGQSAIYQIEQFGSLIHPAVFIMKDRSVYIINILNDDESHRSTIDDFIKNFQFNS